MERFRFVGSFADLGDRTLERFGQVIDLEPAQAATLTAQNVPLLPEDLWAESGITEKECAEWSSLPLHEGAPAEFLAKRAKVWDLLHQYRTPKEN